MTTMYLERLINENFSVIVCRACLMLLAVVSAIRDESWVWAVLAIAWGGLLVWSIVNRVDYTKTLKAIKEQR